MDMALGNPAAATGPVTVKLAPLDVPLDLEWGTGAARGGIAAACHGWEGDADPLVPPLRLRLDASPTLTGTGGTRMQVDGAIVAIRGPGVLAQAELDEGFARCTVSVGYLHNPAALRREVLEPLVLMLLTRRDRTPFHASGFVADGVAVLLAGRSGAGKSCLASAADVAGFQVLSDDTVFVQLAPALKAWGWPTAAHLLARDAPGAAGPTRLRKGKVKHVVSLRSASHAPIACEQAALCLLSRGDEPALGRISPAEARARLWPLDEGFDRLPRQLAKVIDRLSAGGAWDLRLSTDPAAAIRLLAANLPRLKESAAS